MAFEYLGKVNSIITGSSLAKLMGYNYTTNYITDGDITWLKYRYNGKVILLASTILIENSDWNFWNNLGFMSGKNIPLGDRHSICRTFSSEEYEELIVKLVPNVEDSHWDTHMNFTTSKNSSGDKVIFRGGYGDIDKYTYYTPRTSSAGFGIRPLLELLPNNSININISDYIGTLFSFTPINYNVSGDEYSLVEKLDNEIIKKLDNQSPNTTQVLDISSRFSNISYGKHTIEIIVSDKFGVETSKFITFNKVKPPTTIIPLNSSLKQALNQSKEIDGEIDYQCLRFRNALIKKNIEVLPGDKISTLIDKVERISSALKVVPSDNPFTFPTDLDTPYVGWNKYNIKCLYYGSIRITCVAVRSYMDILHMRNNTVLSSKRFIDSACSYDLKDICVGDTIVISGSAKYNSPGTCKISDFVLKGDFI